MRCISSGIRNHIQTKGDLQWTKGTVLNGTVRVADAAGVHLDQNLSFLRIFDFDFFDDQFSANIWHDGCLACLWIIAHFCKLW
jgi:hypothetical protein